MVIATNFVNSTLHELYSYFDLIYCFLCIKLSKHKRYTLFYFALYKSKICYLKICYLNTVIKWFYDFGWHIQTLHASTCEFLELNVWGVGNGRDMRESLTLFKTNHSILDMEITFLQTSIFSPTLFSNQRRLIF